MLAPHQTEAVERLTALLDRFGGAILADDVGLGKSFVATAVACAMRGRGYEIELIVPASLVAQWRELVDAPILTHDALAGDPRLPSGDRLIVVDEAHAFRNRKTQRWAALARRSIGARLLLVTATPVCNSAGDLFALVSLIAADDALREHGVASIEESFARRDARAIDAVVAALVVRRDRDVLPRELYFGELEPEIVRYELADAPIDALQFPLSASAPLLRQILWRRLESSDAALLESAGRQRRFYERVLESGRRLTRADYRRAFAHEEESDAVQQILFWDLWTSDREVDLAAIRDEMHRLDALRAFVEAAPSRKHALLPAFDEPALIFTGSVATARDLAKRLGCAVATSRDGTAAIESFRRGRVDRLVATDLAAEGLNLQRAGVVVHYDIPWNPVKLDQRNGRAYRIGQTRPSVRAIYFLPERDRTRIVATIDAKNAVRHRVLAPQETVAVDLAAMPPHLPRDAPPAVLLRALELAGFDSSNIAQRRWRAGVELVMSEMAREYLDDRRLRDLRDILRSDASV